MDWTRHAGVAAHWPCHDGLPFGTQLTRAPFEEARLLAAARWVETAMGITGPPAR